MNWVEIGIPSAVVLISSALFVWYHRITQATIEKLKVERDNYKHQVSHETVRQNHGKPILEAHQAQQVLVDKGKTRDITLTSISSPSLSDFEAKEEKDKIILLLNLLDRKSISHYMNEEIMGAMCVSLNQLRIQLQEQGVSTIKDMEIRNTFKRIIKDIEQIIILSSFLNKIKKNEYEQYGEEEIFNLSWFFNHLDDLERELEKLQSYYIGTAQMQTEERINDMLKFFNQRIKEAAEQEGKINSHSLPLSFGLTYILGAIDELKYDIKSNRDDLFRRMNYSGHNPDF